MDKRARIFAALAGLVLGAGCSSSKDSQTNTVGGGAGTGSAGRAGNVAGSSTGGARTGGSGGTPASGGGPADGGARATGGSTAGTGSVVMPSCNGGAASTVPTGTAPDLTPGVWKNITPAALDLRDTFGSVFLEIDPRNSDSLIATADQRGMYKTSDRGSTWTKLGDPSATYNYETTAKYLDSPIVVRIDPCDSKHLYATQGVRGKTLGFWESKDGGDTWTMPQGFIDVSATIGTRDMTLMAVDPADFRHMLIGSHSAWKGLSNSGLLETTDGGTSFIVHQPHPSWPAGSMGVSFLYDPELGIGNARTWLVTTDADGYWRTTDAGANWTRVETFGAPHGGAYAVYASTGVLYAGGYQYPVRSTDNGSTWTQLMNGLGYSYYYTIVGDGHQLYTMSAFASAYGVKYGTSYMTSKESDGLTWTVYQGGAQKFDNGPASMRFDKVNRIMYSSNWAAGIWALRVIDP